VTLGLRSRVTLWSTGVNGLVLLVGTLVLFWALDQQLTGDLDEALAAQSRTSAVGVEAWLTGRLGPGAGRISSRAVSRLLDSEDLRSGLGDLFAMPRDVPAALPTVTTLLDSTGRVLMSSHSPTAATQPSAQVLEGVRLGLQYRTIATEPDGQERQGAYRASVTPVRVHGRIVAFVQVLAPLRPVRDTLTRVQSLLAVSVLALLLLNALLIGLALRRALRPIDALQAELRRITERNLSVRVPVPPPRDEVHRLAETFNALLERLDRGFSFQTRLFQDLSHQLKTPLAILTGTLETALVRGRSVDEYRTILESSLDEVARMTRLIESLLLLARLDSQQLVLQAKPVEWGTFCRAWLDDFSLLLEGKNLTLAWDQSCPLPVTIDGHRIGQALLNVFDNSVKHSPEGGVVGVRLRAQAGKAILEMTNQGPPLDPKDLELVFRRFWREASGSSGFGLGLPIARAALELHGGTLTAFLPDTGGTGFRFELPLGPRVG